MSELMPCPFCGGEASSTGVLRRSHPCKDAKWKDGTPIQDAYFVNCVKCGVDNGGFIAGGFQAREEAIEHWNQRATYLPPAAPECSDATETDAARKS